MSRYYNLFRKTMRKNININLTILALAAIMMASCVSPRRINYLQDMTHGSQIELENRFEARVAPYDELSIQITSPSSPALAEPFNRNFNNNGSQGSRSGYLVDVNGNIDLPYLGRIRVAGMTRLQLQDSLSSMLVRGGYISDAFVTVRFSNFKIFFVGSGRGQVLNIANERCTFLEALAMLGDLGNYTRRDKIAVMREINGKMVMRYLDPRSSDVFNDPFFMLQQNDFIIVENYNSGVLINEMSVWMGLFSTIASMASLAATVMLYMKMK